MEQFLCICWADLTESFPYLKTSERNEKLPGTYLMSKQMLAALVCTKQQFCFKIRLAVHHLFDSRVKQPCRKIYFPFFFMNDSAKERKKINVHWTCRLVLTQLLYAASSNANATFKGQGATAAPFISWEPASLIVQQLEPPRAPHSSAWLII